MYMSFLHIPLFWNPVRISCDIWLALSFASSGCDGLSDLSCFPQPWQFGYTAQVFGGMSASLSMTSSWRGLLSAHLHCPHPGSSCTALLCVALTVTSVGSEGLRDPPFSQSVTHFCPSLHPFRARPLPLGLGQNTCSPG